MRGADPRTVRIERHLRSRQTEAERKVWFAVRDGRLSGFKFVRQEAIGPFIVASGTTTCSAIAMAR